MAMQVNEQLTIGKPIPQAISGVNRQRRLARPGHAAYHAYTRCLIEPVDQCLQFLAAAGKQGNITGQ
jgi:hypothetical protein